MRRGTLVRAIAVWATLAGCERVEMLESDEIYPAQIDDLACEGTAADVVRCTWTAVGDDQRDGKAARYWIYRHDQAIEQSNLDQATLVDETLRPATAGTREQHDIGQLDPDTDYWFAVKVADYAWNSTLSNSAAGKTLDTIPPAAASELRAEAVPAGNAVFLAWDLPQNTADLVGVLVVREQGEEPADAADGTAVCDSAAGAPAPTCDTATSHLDAGLTDGVTYHYAAFSHDEVPNHGEPARASAVPADSEPPLSLATFEVSRSATPYALDLAWSQPAGQHDDYLGVKILRFETEPDPAQVDPSDPPVEATLVLDDQVPTRTSFLDQGLIDGTEYWYLAYTKDEVPNHGDSLMDSGVAQSGSGADTTRPDPIELFGAAGEDGTSMTLSWLASGDDGGVGGPAQEYDLRYTPDTSYREKAAFDAAWVTLARWTADMPDPGDPGTGQSVTLTALDPDTEYFFGLKAADEVPNWSLLHSVAAVKTKDLTAPGAVTDFVAEDAATGNRLDLSWTAPSDPDLAGLMLRRREGVDPASPEDGDLVCRTDEAPQCGAAEAHADTGLTDGTAYHYAAYAFDDEAAPNYSAAALAVGTPTDAFPPAPLSAFSAADLGTGTSVQLSWTLPVDQTDLEGVLILRRDDAFPAGPTDAGATTVFNGPGTGFVDTQVTVDTTYFYAAFTFDDTPNYSAALTDTVDVIDPGKVDPVTDLLVLDPGVGEKLDLSWVNSVTAGVTHVRVIRSRTGCVDTPDPLPAEFEKRIDLLVSGAGQAQSWTDEDSVVDDVDYCYAVFAREGVTYSTAVTAFGTPTDVTPPDAVSNLAAIDLVVGNTVRVSWTNPTVDYAGCVVQRRAGALPVDRTDGTRVYDGSDIGFDDSGLTDGVEYFYAAWSYDDASTTNWSAMAAQASAIPTDATPPGVVRSFSALAQDNGRIELSWLPPDPLEDWSGVRILRRSDQHPAAHNDPLATLVHDGPGSSITDAATTPATRYFYSAFSFDEVPVYALPAQDSDITRCGSVTGLTVAHELSGPLRTGRVVLRWHNPTDSEFFAALVLRKLGDYATGPADPGAVVICDDPGAEECYDDATVLDQRNYYAVYAHSADSRYALPAVGDIVALIEQIPPQPVTDFTATPDNTADARAIDLSWTNPGDADLAGVIVLRRTDVYPDGPSDPLADLVYEGLNESHRDVPIEDNLVYRYRAWAHDGAPNYATPAEATATRPYTDDDGDGMHEGNGDCDDFNEFVYTGAPPQACTATDWDCDGSGWEADAPCDPDESCEVGGCSCGGTGPDCGAGETCCGTSCVDIQTNNSHCGGCDDACDPNETCSGGECHCNAGGQVCVAPNDTCCVPGGCVDISTDDSHCGDCTTSCDAAEVCEGGDCHCGGSGGPICQAAETCCTDECANLQTSEAHCSGCDLPCDPGETCESGTCRCGGSGPDCSGDQTCCGSDCVDTNSDNGNCGDCGNVCDPGETCESGTCRCGGSGSDCDAPEECCGTQCRNTQTDNNHCGGCNITCDPGESCVTAGCKCGGTGPDCSAPEECCGTKCLDCNDDATCTDDSCDVPSESCVHWPDHNSCSDAQWCNGPEQCDPPNGAPGTGCRAGTAPDCSDGVACTDDSCSEIGDNCEFTANDSNCDDGQYCNGVETCHVTLGCQPGPGDPCPGTPCNTCQEDTDSCFDPPGTPCTDDAMFCTGPELCDGSGACTSQGFPCNDGVDCTVDSCDETTDTCDNVPNDALCGGGETCDPFLGCQ